MTNILDNELVRTFFKCFKKEGEIHEHYYVDECEAQRALRILQAMQEPIRNGELYLNLHSDMKEPHRMTGGDYQGDRHWYLLRLPDAHQKKECEHFWKCKCGTTLAICDYSKHESCGCILAKPMPEPHTESCYGPYGHCPHKPEPDLKPNTWFDEEGPWTKPEPCPHCGIGILVDEGIYYRCQAIGCHSAILKRDMKTEPLHSCKGKSGQVFCNDKNCGQRDRDGYHYAAGDPRNKDSKPEKSDYAWEGYGHCRKCGNIGPEEHTCKPSSAVEEKIADLIQRYVGLYSAYSIIPIDDIEGELRALVALARKSK